MPMLDDPWDVPNVVVYQKGREVRYPDISVVLVGQDGNAFAILGRVVGALRAAGVEEDEVKLFQKLAMAGTYDELLAEVTRWVDVR